VIDFQRVTGLDSSAVLAFLKIHQLTEARDAALIFCGLRARLGGQLKRGGFDLDAVHVLPDLDHAAQWCEDRLLDKAGVSAAPAETLERLLRDGLGLNIDPARLASYLEPLDVQAGEEIIRQGETSDDMFFLESGSLTAVLTLPNGQRMRLRTMAPGVVVGEIGMYLASHRTASVVSETSSRLHRLSRQALDEMKARDPELAADVHSALARLLAQRLTDLMQAMDVLLD
jgi:sulfate permease, SulP family